MTSLKKKKTLLCLSLLVILMAVFWFFTPQWANVAMIPQVMEEWDLIETNSRTYPEILMAGVMPVLPPEYEFPTGYQYLNGCFGFSVGHILQDRGLEFDMLEMEEKIDKPRKDLWKKEYKERLEEAYGLDFQWFKDAETFFYFLGKGESIVLSYLLEDEGILHAVAAYSFDNEGVWVSDSLTGKTERIPYAKIFHESGNQTLYAFARVVENQNIYPPIH